MDMKLQMRCLDAEFYKPKYAAELLSGCLEIFIRKEIFYRSFWNKLQVYFEVKYCDLECSYGMKNCILDDDF